MPLKQKKKKISAKKMQRGTVGNFFVYGVVALLIVLAVTAVGGLPPESFPNSGQVVNIITPTPGPDYNNLQLKTFGYTVVPSLCKIGGVNNEQTILVGYSPLEGQSVGTTGQIKVWVNDEGPPFISPGEIVDASSGAVLKPGDRTAKASDGYYYEPALYISPDTAETGGHAHFPDYIKGQFNNSPQTFESNPDNPVIVNGPAIDPIPNGGKPIGPNPNGDKPNLYTAEDIWNISGLGLTTGTYEAEFLVHDGDHDRGVGCVSIVIQ